jgi:hypothetical protein
MLFLFKKDLLEQLLVEQNKLKQTFSLNQRLLEYNISLNLTNNSVVSKNNFCTKLALS